MIPTTPDGRGVPVISSWQMNRDGRKEALRTGSYDLGALAETVEAERSTDKVFALLRPDEGTEIKIDVLKNRDGPEPKTIRLDVDLRCGWFGERTNVFPASLLGDDEEGLGF